MGIHSNNAAKPAKNTTPKHGLELTSSTGDKSWKSVKDKKQWHYVFAEFKSRCMSCQNLILSGYRNPGCKCKVDNMDEQKYTDPKSKPYVVYKSIII